MNTKEASIVLGKLAFIFIASWFAIAGGCAKARGDDIWAGSGGYIGHTQDNGYYDSVWDQYGNYRGFIQRDWVNPYVPRIDRGRE